MLLHMVHARCNVHEPTVMIRNVSSRKSVKQKTLSLVTFVYLCQQEHTGNMRTLVVSALFVGWSAGRSNFSERKFSLLYYIPASYLSFHLLSRTYRSQRYFSSILTYNFQFILVLLFALD